MSTTLLDPGGRNMKHAIRIAGALALLSGLVPAWAGDVTVKDTKNLIDDGIVDGSLTAIADKPHAYYKSRVKFVARFDKHGEIHQPFFTIFDSQTHVNFAAWDESTDLRTADGYGDVCRLLRLRSLRPLLSIGSRRVAGLATDSRARCRPGHHRIPADIELRTSDTRSVVHGLARSGTRI